MTNKEKAEMFEKVVQKLNIDIDDFEDSLDEISSDYIRGRQARYDEDAAAEKEYFDRIDRYADDPFGIDERSPFGDEAGTKEFWLSNPDLLDTDLGWY